jgi:1,4-dihydroxy-6-naphthoate synthase
MGSHTTTVRIAYTPDSDDAFYYDALETGALPVSGLRLEFHRAPMSELNRAARRGEYEVSAISSVLYPEIAERYAILSVGTSVGRGYGPVLVGKEPLLLADLRGRRVGVGGIPTTGWFLLQAFCPEAVAVEMEFDRIGAAILAGKLDAGVMIHEELLYYPRLGLHKIADLGALWCEQHALPLPVGLNVIRRDLGAPAMQQLCGAIRQSLQHGLDHVRDVLTRVSRFGRGAKGGVTERFVTMFANQDSLSMPDDVRAGLCVLLSQVADLGLGPVVSALDIVTAPAERTRAALAGAASSSAKILSKRRDTSWT